MFAIKNFETISAQLMLYVSSHTTALTDFNVGSVIRTMLESFAEELEYLYLEMFRGILEGVQTGVYNSFDFQPLPPVSASGLVTFSLSQLGTSNQMSPTSNIVIPAGFQVQVSSSASLVSGSAASGTTYNVVQDTVWPAGQSSVSVLVSCSTAGSSGNTARNTITSIVDDLLTVQDGTFSVTNFANFSNGSDQETQSEMKTRFAQYLQSLGRGTVDALEYAALQGVLTDSNGNIIERVKKAVVVEPYVLDGSKPNAYVDIYVYNGTGNTTSELVSNVQEIIDGYYDKNGNRIPGYKAAGIIAKVLPVTQNPVDFNINVVMQPGYTLTDTIINSITNAISTYVNNLNPGDSLRLNQVITIVNNQIGVYNCYIVSPSSDYTPPDNSTVVIVNGITINAVNSIYITGETKE